MDKDRFYTVPEAAEVLHLSEAEVRELLSTRRLDMMRIKDGGHPRISGIALAAFLEGR